MRLSVLIETQVLCYLTIFWSYFTLPRTNKHSFYQRSPCFIPSMHSVVQGPQSVFYTDRSIAYFARSEQAQKNENKIMYCQLQ